MTSHCAHADCRNPIWNKRAAIFCFRHTEPTRAIVYRVWQAISAQPSASLRELGYQLHIAPSTVNRALWHLQRIGVITKDDRRCRTVRIIEPFNWFQGD